jgi:DNA-binding NarL/FixJ family response regulator
MVVPAGRKDKFVPIKIALVEDFKLTRVGLMCAFEKFNDIRVVAEAENALDGIELIQKTNPDIVLMDIGLPGMSGIEAMVKLKEIMPEIKIIALTSHERAEEVISALSSGANAYCLKDIEPEKLVDVIRYVLTGVCWIDPVVAHHALNALPKNNVISVIAQNNSTLTDREAEVLKLVVAGKSNPKIADELYISSHTAKAHVCSILQKMCVGDRTEAAVKAVREGWV